MTTPSTPTSTMKEAERLTAMAQKCGATVYRNRASVHSPAVAFGDESWARFCETIVGLVTAAAQARSLVEAQPCAVAGEAVPWQSLGELHVDAWGRGRSRVLAGEHGGSITIEATDGEEAWRATIPAPWVKVAAPSAVLPLKVEVPKRCTCERATVPAGKVCRRCGGTGTFAGEGAAAPSYDTRQFSNLSNQAHGFARPLPGGVPTGLPTEAIEDAASVLRHIGPQLNAEWAHRCARAAAALSAGDPSSLQGERK